MWKADNEHKDTAERQKTNDSRSTAAPERMSYQNAKKNIIWRMKNYTTSISSMNKYVSDLHKNVTLSDI